MASRNPTFNDGIPVGALPVNTSNDGLPAIAFTPGLADQTPEQKAAEYNNLRSQGFSDSQIRAAADATFGTQSASDWSYLTDLANTSGLGTTGIGVGGVTTGALQQAAADPIEQLYTQYAGRAADAGGLDYWRNQFGTEVDANEAAIFQRAVAENVSRGVESTATGTNYNAYFAANPDVAAEYMRNAQGMTPDQFAQTHYNRFGINEGRAAPTAGGALALANLLDAGTGTGVTTAWTAPVLKAVQTIGADEYDTARFFNPNDGKTYNSQAEADAANAAIINSSKAEAITDAWTAAQASNDYTELANVLANTSVTGYDLYTMLGMTPAQQAAIAQLTGYDLTPDVITDDRGKTYDTTTVLNLANQLAGIADTSAFSGGVFGVNRGYIGFDYGQAARALGRDLSTGEQVLLDSARNLIDQGITDLSKLGMGDIKSSVTVQEERDEDGSATGRYFALVPTSTDSEGHTTYTTRILTPEEAARIRTEETTGTGDEPYSYTRRVLDDVVTGRGVVYDGRGITTGNQLAAGSTSTGRGGTSYQITYDDQGRPRFTTTGFSTGMLGSIAPLLQIASFIPGVAPFAMAANAAIAASQGNVLGALASLAGMGGYTNLATGLNVANAVNNKDVGALVGALLSNPTIAGAAANTMLTDTISFADLGNAANLAVNIDNKNWAGALGSVASLTGSSDARVAASALTIATELGKDNPNFSAILNAAQTIQNTTSSASRNVDANVVGGITNRVVDEVSTLGDLGTSAYVAAINAGATSEEALAAANTVTDNLSSGTGATGNTGVVINAIDAGGPSNVVTTTYGQGGVDTNFGDLQGAIDTQARNAQVERLGTEYERATGKQIGRMSDNEVASLGIAMQNLSLDQLQKLSVQDLISRTPTIVGKDDRGRWLDSEGYSYDHYGFKYRPGSDIPIIEVRGVGSTGRAEDSGFATNLADSIVENITGLDGTTGRIVQQGLSTILGLAGEQIADLSTSLGNMGIVGRDNAGVRAGTYLEDIANRLQLPETRLAIDNWVNSVDNEQTYYGKIAAGVKGVFQNPLVLTEVVKEVGQELLPGAIALKVAKYAGVAAGAASSTLLNSLESAGSTGRQIYNEEIAKGTPPADAAKIADRGAGYAGLISFVTSGITDATIARKYGAAIEDYLGRKASSTGGEFAQESFEEGLIALATGKTPAEAMTQSVVGGLVGAKTSGTIQTAADAQADLAAAFAAQGLASTDGTFRAETIVPSGTATGNVATGATNVGGVDTTGVTNVGATNVGGVDTTGVTNVGGVDTTGVTNVGATNIGAGNLGVANAGAVDTTMLGGVNLTQALQSGDAGAINLAVTGSVKTSLDNGASVDTAVGGAINTVLTGGGNVDSAVTNSVTSAVESSVGTVLTGGGNVDSAVTNSVTAAVESSVGTVLTGGGNVDSAVTNSVTAAVESSVGTVLTAGGNVDSAVTNSVTAAVESSVGAVLTAGGNVDSAVTNSVTAAVESSVGAVLTAGGNVDSAVTNSVTAAVESSVGAVLTGGGNVDSAVTNSVAAAVTATVTSGGNVDVAVGASIEAAVTAGANVNAAVTAAVNAAVATGNNVTVASDANVTTITNVTTGSTITVDNNTGATTTVNVNTNPDVAVKPDATVKPEVDGPDVDGPGGTDTTVIDSDTINLGDGMVIDITTGETLTPEEIENRRRRSQVRPARTARRPSGMLVGASGATPPYKPTDISETWLGGQFRNIAPLVAFAGLLPENNPMFQEQQALSALRQASGLGREPAKPQSDFFSYGSEPSVSSVLAPFKRGGGVQDPISSGKIMASPLQAASGGDVEHKGSHYVQGAGGGQDDLIPAKLADGEYVFDAEIVAALGDGSNKEGARKLDEFREAIRRHKRSGSIKTIPPKAKSPLAYMKGIK